MPLIFLKKLFCVPNKQANTLATVREYEKQPNHVILNLWLIGPQSVGKSAFAYRFLHSEFKSLQPSKSLTFSQKTLVLSDKSFQFRVFEINQFLNKKQNSLKQGPQKTAHFNIRVLFYDIGNRQSFESIRDFSQALPKNPQFTQPNNFLLLVANKKDLQFIGRQEVSRSQGIAKAKDIGAHGFVQSSSLLSVYHVFYKILGLLGFQKNVSYPDQTLNFCSSKALTVSDSDKRKKLVTYLLSLQKLSQVSSSWTLKDLSDAYDYLQQLLKAASDKRYLIRVLNHSLKILKGKKEYSQRMTSAIQTIKQKKSKQFQQIQSDIKNYWQKFGAKISSMVNIIVSRQPDFYIFQNLKDEIQSILSIESMPSISLTEKYLQEIFHLSKMLEKKISESIQISQQQPIWELFQTNNDYTANLIDLFVMIQGGYEEQERLERRIAKKSSISTEDGDSQPYCIQQVLVQFSCYKKQITMRSQLLLKSQFV